MVLGLKGYINLADCSEHSKVGVFKKLHTDVRQVVDVTEQAPSVSPLLSTTFPKIQGLSLMSAQMMNVF
jgi:hypothetical protein